MMAVTVEETPESSRLAKMLALKQVRYLLLIATVLVYIVCIGYLWLRGVADLFDFNAYYMAAYAFAHDVDIYSVGTDASGISWSELGAAAGVEHFSTPFRYPPFIAQLVLPLSSFSPFVAGLIWLTLNALAFLIATWWLGKLWAQPEGASIVTLLMLGYIPPIIAMREGQVTGLLLLALVAAFAGLSRRNAVMAGSALALAVHLKLSPIVLCLYLGWRKQWRAAVVATLLLFGLVLSVLPIFGFDALTSYAQNFSATTVFGQLFPRLANQSIAGLWARLLLPYLERPTIYQVYLLSAVMIVGATIMVCWPLRGLFATWRYEYALILCSMLLILPFTWYHMLTLLLIPLVVAVEYLWRKQQWQWLMLLGVLYLATDVHGVIYRHVAMPPWLSSFPLAFMLCLWGLLAWMIVEARRHEAEGDATQVAITPGSWGKSVSSVGQ